MYLVNNDNWTIYLGCQIEISQFIKYSFE